MVQTRTRLRSRDFLDSLIIGVLLILFFIGLWQLCFIAETAEKQVTREVTKFARVLAEDQRQSESLIWSWFETSSFSDIWYKPEPHAPWQPLKKPIILFPGAQLKTGAQGVVRLQITDRRRKQQRMVELPKNSFFVLLEGESDDQIIPLHNLEQIKRKEHDVKLPEGQDQELWWIKSPRGRVVSDENLARHVPLAWAYLQEEPFLLKVGRIGHPDETRTKKLNKGFVEWSFEKSGRYVITVEGLNSKRRLTSQFELAILKTPVWRFLPSGLATRSLQDSYPEREIAAVPKLSLPDASASGLMAEKLEIRLLDEKGQEWSQKSAHWLGRDFHQIWQDLLPQLGEKFGGRLVSLQTRQWSSEAQSPWSAPMLVRVPPVWKSKLGRLRWSNTNQEVVWNEENKTCSPPMMLPKVWEGPEQVFAFLRIYNEHVDVRYDLRTVDTKKGICPILPPGNYQWDYELAMRPYVGSEEWETVPLLKGKPLVVRWQELGRENLMARLGSSSWGSDVVALDPKQYGVRWLPPRTTLYSSRDDGWMWYELNWVADDEALVAFEVRWGEDPRLPDSSSYRQWIKGRTYLLMLPKKRVWYARVFGFNRQGQAVTQSPLREIRSVVLKNSQYLPAISAITTDQDPETR